MIAAGLAFATCFTPASRAQDASGDAALDDLLKDIEDDKKTPDKPGDAKAEDDKPAPKTEVDKPTEKPEADKPAAKPQEPGGKPAGKAEELSGKDKELDDLLESLGETKDEPKSDDEKQPPGGPGGEDEDKGQGPGDQDQPPQGQDQEKGQGQGKGGDRQPGLSGRDRAIDEELEELTGRRRKKKGGDQQQQGEGSGPMGELIKEMRDVEKRLGEPDTGEETRGKQQQLVKKMETLIEQIRRQGKQQQQSGMAQQQSKQQGGKPGDQQQGDQAGDNPGGAPDQRPRTPNEKRSPAGGKDAWGHLPPELRQEMENVAKEESLVRSEDLIRRYYLSVSRGKLNRGE